MCGHENGLLYRLYIYNLFAAGVLGNCFGAFRHSMFCKFTRQEETNCCLDFARWNCLFLVLKRQSRSFRSNSLEDVVHEGVHDAHGLGWYTNIRMDLLQNVVDVDSIGLLSSSLSLLLSLRLQSFHLSCLHVSLPSWQPSGACLPPLGAAGALSDMFSRCRITVYELGYALKKKYLYQKKGSKIGSKIGSKLPYARCSMHLLFSLFSRRSLIGCFWKFRSVLEVWIRNWS